MSSSRTGWVSAKAGGQCLDSNGVNDEDNQSQKILMNRPRAIPDPTPSSTRTDPFHNNNQELVTFGNNVRPDVMQFNSLRTHQMDTSDQELLDMRLGCNATTGCLSNDQVRSMATSNISNQRLGYFLSSEAGGNMDAAFKPKSNEWDNNQINENDLIQMNLFNEVVTGENFHTPVSNTIGRNQSIGFNATTGCLSNDQVRSMATSNISNQRTGYFLNSEAGGNMDATFQPKSNEWANNQITENDAIQMDLFNEVVTGENFYTPLSYTICRNQSIGCNATTGCLSNDQFRSMATSNISNQRNGYFLSSEAGGKMDTTFQPNNQNNENDFIPMDLFNEVVTGENIHTPVSNTIVRNQFIGFNDTTHFLSTNPIIRPTFLQTPPMDRLYPFGVNPMPRFGSPSDLFGQPTVTASGGVDSHIALPSNNHSALPRLSRVTEISSVPTRDPNGSFSSQMVADHFSMMMPSPPSRNAIFPPGANYCAPHGATNYRNMSQCHPMDGQSRSGGAPAVNYLPNCSAIRSRSTLIRPSVKDLRSIPFQGHLPAYRSTLIRPSTKDLPCVPVQGHFPGVTARSGPRVHDPRVHDPRVHDPRVHDPRVHDPRVHDPRVKISQDVFFQSSAKALHGLPSQPPYLGDNKLIIQDAKSPFSRSHKGKSVPVQPALNPILHVNNAQARKVAIQRASASAARVYAASMIKHHEPKTLSSQELNIFDRIKCQDDNTVGLLGIKCELCNIDLCLEPTGSSENHSDNPPASAVFPCGHHYHDTCFKQITGVPEQCPDPPCVLCTFHKDHNKA